jgi:hypothetical protein
MPRRPPSIAGIALWLAWQLTALGLSAFRVPLSAHYPAAAEQWALALMLASQIAGSALLFPILLKDAKSTLVAIALAWPICELASFLADADQMTFAVGELYVSAWLIALYLWNRFASCALGPALLSSLVALLTYGGPLIAYLHAEFNANSSSGIWPHPELLGPVVGVLSLIQTAQSHYGIWLTLIILMIAAPVFSLLTRGSHPTPAV